MIDIEIKELYNLDNHKQASKWVKDCNVKNTEIVPHLTCGVNIAHDWKYKIDKTAIGYAFFKSNNVYYNPTHCSIFSTMFSDAHGLTITANNFEKVCALFTARKSIVSEWYNQKDEYFAP